MTSSDGCEMCHDPIFSEKDLEHPHKIAELDVSIAVLNREWQYYRGSAILMFRDHVTELHHLDRIATSGTNAIA